MLWVGLDFETTGLNPTNDRITEIGACLWHAEGRCILECFSCFVWDQSYPIYQKEALATMDCAEEVLKKHAFAPSVAFEKLLHLVQAADFVVAHNAKKFDKLFFEEELKRQRVVLRDDIAWIDSSVDVPYPQSMKTRKLIHLAAEHGFLNPYAHRALTDVITMLTVMAKYDPHLIAVSSVQEDVLLHAAVSFDDKHLAQDRGYRWNKPSKRWEKLVKEGQVIEEMKAPFKVFIIKEM